MLDTPDTDLADSDVRNWRDSAIGFVKNWYGIVILAFCLFLLGALIVWAFQQRAPQNCKPTGAERTIWIMSGKTYVPIIQHEYICTSTEWY